MPTKIFTNIHRFPCCSDELKSVIFDFLTGHRKSEIRRACAECIDLPVKFKHEYKDAHIVSALICPDGVPNSNRSKTIKLQFYGIRNNKDIPEYSINNIRPIVAVEITETEIFR